MFNKLIFSKISPSVIFIMLLTWMPHAGAETLPKVQTLPIKLHASNILPKELLAAPNYQVKENVLNDGFVNTYELSTTYGPLKVESTALLMIRLDEIKVLKRMEELKNTKVFKDATCGKC